MIDTRDHGNALDHFVSGVVQFLLTLFVVLLFANALDAWRGRQLQVLLGATGEKATRGFCVASLRLNPELRGE